ncbi:MAG: dihydrofolate reductase family protein [Verrucomicrobiota bacterium]|nr:dihydrofolate reductase family protein [Verrucomicrobiota bacterium]
MEIVLIAVQSIDGFITRHDEAGAGFASPADQAWFRTALDHCDAVVMGSRTYAHARTTIRESLRHNVNRYVLTREPTKWAADVVPGKLEFTSEEPSLFATRMRHAGCKRLGVLGGGQVNAAFLRANLVDALWLTIEPRLFGHGVALCPIRLDLEWELLEQRLLSPSVILLTYRRASGGTRPNLMSTSR